MRVFTVKLSEEERGYLERLRARYGLRSQADMVRKMIAETADRAGMVPNTGLSAEDYLGEPKPKPASKPAAPYGARLDKKSIGVRKGSK